MDARGPLAALVFKVQMWEGRRHVFARLYRGTLKPGDEIAIPGLNGTLRQERVARLFEVDANHKNRLDEASAGQIVLLAPRDSIVGEGFVNDPRDQSSLEPPSLVPPPRSTVLGLLE